MKLIIDIPDKAYNRLLEEQHLPNRLDIEWVIVHGKPLNDELQEIRQEIQANMEDIIGHYSNTPFKDMPSSKIFRNEGRQECLEIIDKHISRKENN